MLLLTLPNVLIFQKMFKDEWYWQKQLSRKTSAFQTNFIFLDTLEKPQSQTFLNVFRGYKKETLAWNWSMKSYWESTSKYQASNIHKFYVTRIWRTRTFENPCRCFFFGKEFIFIIILIYEDLNSLLTSLFFIFCEFAPGILNNKNLPLWCSVCTMENCPSDPGLIPTSTWIEVLTRRLPGDHPF